MRINLMGIFILGILFLSPGVALSHGMHGMMEECQADREKYCQEATGRRQGFHCLWQNRDLVSPACQQRLDQANQMKEKFKALHQACQADREKYCGNVPREHGKLRACMVEHEEKLSETCRAARKEMKELKQQWKSSSSSPGAWGEIRSQFI